MKAILSAADLKPQAEVKISAEAASPQNNALTAKIPTLKRHLIYLLVNGLFNEASSAYIIDINKI